MIDIEKTVQQFVIDKLNSHLHGWDMEWDDIKNFDKSDVIGVGVRCGIDLTPEQVTDILEDTYERLIPTLIELVKEHNKQLLENVAEYYKEENRPVFDKQKFIDMYEEYCVEYSLIKEILDID